MIARRLAVGAALALALGLVVPGAEAQDRAPFLQVRAIDSSSPDVVDLTVSYAGRAADLEAATVTEAGREIAIDTVTPTAAAGPPLGIVLAIDTSDAMRTGASLRNAKQAAIEFVSDMPAGTEVAIVSFGTQATLVRGLTSDPALLAESIESLQAGGPTALWDGVVASAQVLEEEPQLQPNVLLITGTQDTASVTDPGAARGDLQALGASLWVAAVSTGSYDSAPLEGAVSAVGGRHLSTSDPARLSTVVAEQGAAVVNQFHLVYPTAINIAEGRPGSTDLSLTVAGQTVELRFVPGSDSQGVSAIQRQDPSRGGGISLFHNEAAKWGAILLGIFAAAAAAYALFMVGYREDTGLDAVLTPYGPAPVTGAEEEESANTTRAILDRAVALTEELAERQGVLARAEGALERAALPLRAAEFLIAYAAIIVLGFVGGFIVTQSIMTTLIIGGVVAMIPTAVVNYIANKRSKAFLAQLPDMLTLLSGTLRAGYSLMQGVEAVAQEVTEPMGVELQRIITEARLGRPLEEALDAAAERLQSDDFSWAVLAIRIQREVGGNLAELLMTVAETMTAREQLRREVDSLTAEGKVSAIVLGILPLALGGVMYVVNPEYIGLLFSSQKGMYLVGGAVLLALAGFAWMKKIVAVEI